MKIHEFDVLISQKEGKRVQVDIAQIKEVRRCINEELCGLLNILIKFKKTKGDKMKKLALLFAMILVAGNAFAMANNNTDKCRSLAYQACTEKLKTYDPNKINPNGTKGACVVNPTSAEFKACEKQQLDLCVSGVVLDTTSKPCN